jgi:hypothetical protein
MLLILIVFPDPVQLNAPPEVISLEMPDQKYVERY